MEESEIHRQHDETSMTEVVGETCQDFLVAFDPREQLYHIFYLKLSNIYHRFYLDAGCLFWQSNYDPDEDDDLGDGDYYVNLGQDCGLIGSSVEYIFFKNDRLEMKFSNGPKLLFLTDIDGGGRMITIYGS